MSDGAMVQVGADRVVYRASALASCETALVAARMEYAAVAPPAKMQKVFDAGHEAEHKAIAQMRADGWMVWDGQAEVTFPVTQKIAVVGHIDGRYCKPDTLKARQRVFDVKSVSDAQWRRFARYGWAGGLFPKYRWQFGTYEWATGLPCDLILFNRETEVMSYEGRCPNIPSVEEIRARVLGVEAKYRAGVLPEDCPNPMYPCPYFYLHASAEATDVETGETVMVTELDNDLVDSLAVAYKQAQLAETIAKGKKKAASDGLMTALGTGDKIGTERGVTVTRVRVKGGHVEFDRKASEYPKVDVPEEMWAGEGR